MKTLIFTDSKCLFDTIIKLISVSEKRLLVDIAAIKENHTSGDLSNVAHVASNYKIVNVFTTEKSNPKKLHELMSTGILSHPVSQWIIPQ